MMHATLVVIETIEISIMTSFHDPLILFLSSILRSILLTLTSLFSHHPHFSSRLWKGSLLKTYMVHSYIANPMVYVYYPALIYVYCPNWLVRVCSMQVFNGRRLTLASLVHKINDSRWTSLLATSVVVTRFVSIRGSPFQLVFNFGEGLLSAFFVYFLNLALGYWCSRCSSTVSFESNQSSAPVMETHVFNSRRIKVSKTKGMIETTAVKEECCICLTQLHDGDLAVKTRCGHYYHAPCVQTWVQSQYHGHQIPTCPSCRRDICVDSKNSTTLL